MAFAPDGRWLVAGGAYHGFGVWQVEGDPPTLTMRNRHDIINNQVQIFVPGQPARLLVASSNRTARLIDLADRKELPAGVLLNTEPRDLAISPDGRRCAVVFGYSGTQGPKQYLLPSGKEDIELAQPPLAEHYEHVRYSPDGRLLLAYGGSNGLTLWDVRTGRRYWSERFAEQRVAVAAFNSDGRVLAVGLGPRVYFYEVATGRRLHSFRAAMHQVSSLSFVGPTGLLGTGCSHGVVHVWDKRTEVDRATPMPEELGHGFTAGATTGLYAKRLVVGTHTRALAFAPDGATLAVGGYDNVYVVDLAKEQTRKTLPTDRGCVNWILYAPDGKSLFAATEYYGSLQRPIHAWDVPSYKLRWQMGRAESTPRMLALANDGATLFSAGKGVHRWQAHDGKQLPSIDVGSAYATALTLAPDGTKLAVGGASREVLIVDPRDPRGARIVTATDDRSESSPYCYALAYSPDGGILATAMRDGTVRLWSTKDWELLREWRTGDGQRDGVAQLQFDPKGAWIAVAGGPGESGLLQLVEVYRVSDGVRLIRLEGIGPQVAWSPDSRWLATAERYTHSKTQGALLWDMRHLLKGGK